MTLSRNIAVLDSARKASVLYHSLSARVSKSVLILLALDNKTNSDIVD